MSNIWEKLSAINVNHHVKNKQGKNYLSWSWAWGTVKEHYPDVNYKVVNFDGKPYLNDSNFGVMVQTEVTIDGMTIPMHLFVMDGANKAQKDADYTYMAKGKEKSCLAASMFDINTTIMRCLVKNLAMFGLGYYIYAGEDLPIETETAAKERVSGEIALEAAAINKCKSMEELQSAYTLCKHKKAVEAYKDTMKIKLSEGK